MQSVLALRSNGTLPTARNLYTRRGYFTVKRERIVVVILYASHEPSGQIDNLLRQVTSGLLVASNSFCFVFHFRAYYEIVGGVDLYTA